MIDLSIVIPHYNSAKSLDRLIRSIPIMNNIQVIVVDDKSDKELEKIDSLIRKHSHVEFYINETNKEGAGVCRNIGLEKVRGEWILFADSDDFFLGNFYGQVYKFLKSESDVIFFKPTSIEADTGNKSDRHVHYENLINNYIFDESIENELFLRYRFWVPWSKLIKHSFIKRKNIRFDEVIASNDVMFSTKLGYSMKQFEVSEEVIYCVTRGKGSLTTRTNVSIYESRLLTHINYCKYLKSRLDKNELNILHLNGGGMLLSAFKFKLGVRNIISVYFKLKRNRINILDHRFINPMFVFRKGIYHLKKYFNAKKYIS